jgi:Flp pilus assembly protein TadG
VSRLQGDDGSAVVELAPVALVVIIFLALMVTAGRITIGELAVQAAARDAARQASIARNPQAAAAAAETSARAALAGDQLNCSPAVSVNTAGFLVPVGQPASVSATVTCEVSMAGVTGIPGIPGSRLVTATSTSPLDVFRGR